MANKFDFSHNHFILSLVEKMSNLKEKIAAFENRSLMASQPPPHHHKEQVIHSSQHQQPPQTNRSGGLNVPPSAVGHGTPSPSTPSVATNINHHHTTTPTISAKTPMSSHHSNGMSLSLLSELSNPLPSCLSIIIIIT